MKDQVRDSRTAIEFKPGSEEKAMALLRSAGVGGAVEKAAAVVASEIGAQAEPLQTGKPGTLRYFEKNGERAKYLVKDNGVEIKLTSPEWCVFDALEAVVRPKYAVSSWETSSVVCHPHTYVVLVQNEGRSKRRGFLEVKSDAPRYQGGQKRAVAKLDLVSEPHDESWSLCAANTLDLPDDLQREIVLRGVCLWAGEVVCEVANRVGNGLRAVAAVPAAKLCADLWLFRERCERIPRAIRLGKRVLRNGDFDSALDVALVEPLKAWLEWFEELYGNK